MKVPSPLLLHPSAPRLPNMRLDMFLKFSRLAARRPLAQEMCEAGAVRVNGLQAKSAHIVREGDLLSIRSRGRIITVRVVSVPSKPTSKREAPSLYETISNEAAEI